MSALSWFAGFFQGGGPFMFVILATGLLILATAIERFWVIGRAVAWNTGKLADELAKLAARGDETAAIAKARSVKAPAGRVALAILTCADRSEPALNAAADGEAAIALSPCSRRLAHIGLLGNVATLLGLLGTIFGLTTAFAAVGAADPSERSAFLAAGISQALNTTAFGLLIAVPALLVHGFLASRVEDIADGVDEVAVKLVRALARPSSAAAAPAAHGAPGAPHAASAHAVPAHAAPRPAQAR